MNAGQWSGNPSRGGLAQSSSAPISAALVNHAIKFNTTKQTISQAYPVQMGPFSANGFTNLYATQDARAANPPPPGLEPFPPYDPSAGDFVKWANDGRMVFA